ncbi:ankyrin repeat-containing domain protein [Apiospora arundinis]
MPSLSSYTPKPDPSEYAADGYSPLLDIIIANDVQALDEFIEKYDLDDQGVPEANSDVFKVAIRPIEGPGHNPASAYRRSEEIVGILLDYGARVQVRAHESYKQLKREEGRELCTTPLSLAIHYISPTLLRRFIDLGVLLLAPLVLKVPLQAKYYEDVTLMYIAVTFVNYDAIKILLGTAEGREMLSIRDKLGRLPVHWAANCGTHDIEMKPDEETTRQGEAQGNYPPSFRNAIIHLLLANGADVALRNHKGDTALGLVIVARVNPPPTALLSSLLAHGAALNETADGKGNTPLHFTAESLPRGLGNVKFLLERGADPTLVNADGDTAAHKAPRSQAKNHINDMTREIKQVFELLEKASGDTQVRDQVNNAGVTPRGVLMEEQAGLAQRTKTHDKREMRLARGRAGYRGVGRGRGRGS